MNQSQASVEIFTIGHSNLAIETFVANLQAHHIQQVVDVRTHPHSRFSPQYNRKALDGTLANLGVTYIFLGKSLGGRPSDPTCYKYGKVPPPKSDFLSLIDYSIVATRAWYLEGVEQLIERANEKRTAIMCSEEDPLKCHRHHLIAQTLLQCGITVHHIRKSGAVQDAKGLL